MKNQGMIAVVFFCFSSVLLFAGPYGGGSGTTADPYQIADVDDLLELAATTADYDKCFILTVNLDLSGRSFSNAVIAWDTISNNSGFDGPQFTGVFDGDHHMIANLTITGIPGNSGRDNNSLIGSLGSGGQIKNLRMVNASLTGRYNVGNFAGESYGTISQCYAENFTVLASGQAGGIAGFNMTGGIIRQCYAAATGDVRGSGNIGGITGYGVGSIIQSYAACPVTTTTTYSYYVGGLVGFQSGMGAIRQSYASGAVTGNHYAGGLIGYLHGGYVYDSYATGAVTGNTYIGGLCGVCSYSELYNCYSTGFVSGSGNVGGLGGNRIGSIITSCFWDMNTSGQTTSFFGTGKTTSEMKTLSTFTSAGWDFRGETANGTNDYWWMRCDGMNYPLLSWQTLSEGDFVCPSGVAMEDFAYLAGRWLRTDCAVTDRCEGADLDLSGEVEIEDMIQFVSRWLND